MWRASRNLIPTATNLMSKHVPTNGMCSLCNFYVTTTSHCQIFCPVIKHIWIESLFWIHLRNMKSASFMECGMVLANMMTVVDLELFAFFSWAV